MARLGRTEMNIGEQSVMREEFAEAWRAMADTGPGSARAVDHCGALIKSSDRHKQLIFNDATRLFDEVANALDRYDAVDKRTAEDLMLAIGNALYTTAAIYLVYGAVVGIGSVIGVRPDLRHGAVRPELAV